MADYDMTRGTAGTTGQMTDDLMAYSDEAKRVAATRRAAVEANAQQSLQAVQSQGAGQIKALNDQVADHIMSQTQPKPGSPEYIDALSKRILDMEKKAADVKKSKTNNMEAYNTYMQVADILKKRLHAMQSEAVGASVEPLTDRVGPGTAQPVQERPNMLQQAAPATGMGGLH